MEILTIGASALLAPRLLCVSASMPGDFGLPAEKYCPVGKNRRNQKPAYVFLAHSNSKCAEVTGYAWNHTTHYPYSAFARSSAELGL
jgi:hypothetical protein